MSTIKSSNEHLTFNADGTAKEIRFQADGTQKASISSAGAFTSTTIDATVLTGTIPSFTSTGIDDNATSTAITIDANESIMVNKTSENAAIVGAQFRGDAVGLFQVCRDGGDSLQLNRLSSDGNLVRFYKDTSVIGSIGTYSGDLVVGTTDTGIRFDDGYSGYIPWNTSSNAATDATLDIGAASARYKDLYLSGGLKVGGTGSANTLDDYEEGTWTPQAAGVSSYGTYTYTEQMGHYVKIGNQVTAWINLTNIATSSAGVGGAIIRGLPFTCNWQSGFNGQAVGALGLSYWNNIDGAYINPIVIDGETFIQIYAHTGVTNNYDTVAITDKTSNSADIRGFVTYYTGG